MDLKQKIDEFKHIIIFGGLAIGFLSNWGKMPEELPILGSWTGKFCGAVILLAAYSYYSFHHAKAMRYGPQKISYQSRYPSRNISKGRQMQRPQQNVQPRQPRVQGNPNVQPRDVFKEFEKE